MIRILIFFLISLILANCSLNENSKIWNKKKIIKVEKNIVVVNGTSKQLVGQVAAEIKSFRKPEPYKG